MNFRNISLAITFLIIFSIILSVFYFINQKSSDMLNAAISNPLMKRQVVQIPLNTAKQPSIAASKLPQFVFNLADKKFDSLVNATSGQVDLLTKVKIVHAVYGADIQAKVSVDRQKRKLLVQPQDVSNFKPGLYKLSLQLRTLDGVVNIDQDFTWGVIAINTNKSIYKQGETAQIGLGVLDDKGNTLCKTGLFNKVDDISLVVTDPKGKKTNFSLNDNTIRDSGKCGPNTVTNVADFQASYPTTMTGVYQMKVAATVYGKTRQIEDYFKVDPSVQFDVERTSFPTRIYPESPYPVTLTVTAKQNYQGTVEDIVPAFFGIDHVDGGQTEKDENFTKIVWNANLTAGQPQTFTYFITFPRISPEFYLIGPLKIGSFQEARQWQIASDAINSDSGVFTAEDNTGSHTWYRTWTGTAWNPALGTSPNSMSAVPQDSRWFKEVSSPITGEKLVGIEDNTGTDIYVFRWDGTTWNQDITMSTTIVGANSQYMDIGYNQLSGNAMLVYCDSGQTQIHYDRRINGVWDHSGNFASTVPSALGTSTTQKSWVRILPQANSDNMLIGYLDTGNHVGGFIYDGDNNAIVSSSEIVDNVGTTAPGHTHEDFAMAYETNTQIPMILWSTGATSIVYRRFTGGAWSAESTTGLTGYAANVDWVNAASDDSSNDIAIGTQNTGAAGTVGCDFAIWDGSSWTKGSTTTCTTDSFTRNINVAWEHGTGKAVWVYVASANNKVLTYRTWQSGTFSGSSTISGTESNQIKTVELYSDPNTVSIMCIITTVDPLATANDEAFDTEWNGSSWTALPIVDTSALFAAVGGAADAQPEEAFGFGFDLNLEKQVAYRWFANSPGNSTSVDTALASQDTPTTLTSANEAFRLRMLLYYPDSLAVGGRSYILQYVDPGSGSCSNPGGDGTPANWSDVPNVHDSSNTLAYNDNASVASSSAATASSPSGLDPTYTGSTRIFETYNEQNTFTTTSAVSGTNVGLFDFSLVDKTTFGRSATTFCFRVKRSTGVILKIGNYPQITTASLNDVQINGGSTIHGGTMIQ